jgi:DNA helicase-2/ATP-dependent DNA helicase PcrA
MISAGPVELGRGVVVLPGDEPPVNWASAPRVVVDDASLAAPGAVLEELHGYWLNRQPVVIELGADPAALRAPEDCTRPVYELTPLFEFSRERLQFLVWANNYDARGGTPIWWHGRKAARRFAAEGVRESEGWEANGGEAVGGAVGDLVTGDGSPLFIDGGPPQPPALASGIPVVHRWNAEVGRLRAAGRAGAGRAGAGRAGAGSSGVAEAAGAGLAPDQLAAVSHRSGPARVIAPAGSGKTRVLTERLRYLVSECGVDPRTITALAYNTKAAGELRERCADVEGGQALNIRTLNSLGLWICNEFGRSGRLRVLEEPAVRDLVQRHVEIRRQANTDTVAPYLEALSAIRLGLTDPQVVEEEFPDAAGIAGAFAPYRAALREAGAVDFDEQIYWAIEILLANAEARTVAQAKCRFLLVDEFQDLNPAHLLLIRILAAPSYDCFGVGDDDQVIYGYSGASPEFLINYPRYFPGATAHALTVNYRCPPEVVGAARHLLSYNARRVQKEIHTPGRRPDLGGGLGDGEGGGGEGGDGGASGGSGRHAFDGPLAGSGPVAVLTGPADGLAGLAVDTIAAWRAGGVAAADIAVLARVNSALLPVQVACMEASVPCGTPLSASVLQRTGIRTAFAYIRIGCDPHHIAREDILETIRRPSRGIAPKVVDMLTSRPTTSIADIRRLAGRLSGRDVPKLGTYAADLDTVVRGCGRSSSAALKAIRLEVGLGETMDVLDSSRTEVDRSTHADDLAALEAVAGLHPDVATFESWLRDVLGRSSGGGPLVLLSTVHRIKGREWDHVIIFDASRGLFPHRLGNDEEGERRVFHVALTRARTQVVALADEDAPSIFLAELDGSRARPDASTAQGGRGDWDGRSERNERRASAKGASGSAAGKGAGSGRARRTAAKGNSVFAEVRLPTVEAVPGLVVDDRGSVGTVVEVSAEAAILSIGTVRMKVALGSDVRVDGKTVTLVAPGTVAPGAEAEKALRAWRTALASQEAVPAYVILKDAELAGIAVRDPCTLAELAACRGMGQIRLERWGDEILAVLDTARSA